MLREESLLDNLQMKVLKDNKKKGKKKDLKQC